MVRILSNNYDMQIIKWAGIKGGEYLLSRRVNCLGRIFRSHESDQVMKVGLIKFLRQVGFPGRMDLYINRHTGFSPNYGF